MSIEASVPPVAEIFASVAIGGLLEQSTVRVIRPGALISEPRPYASKARNSNVASPQKSITGINSNVPSGLRLTEPDDSDVGVKSEYERDHPEFVSVARVVPVILIFSCPVNAQAYVMGGLLDVTTSAVRTVVPISFVSVSV